MQVPAQCQQLAALLELRGNFAAASTACTMKIAKMTSTVGCAM